MSYARWYVCVLTNEGLIPLVGPYENVTAAAVGWQKLTTGGMPADGWLLTSGDRVAGDLVLGAASPLSSPFIGLGEDAEPELWSSAAKGIGREGIVTVWDDEGHYAGCMGAERWQRLRDENDRGIARAPACECGQGNTWPAAHSQACPYRLWHARRAVARGDHPWSRR